MELHYDVVKLLMPLYDPKTSLTNFLQFQEGTNNA